MVTGYSVNTNGLLKDSIERQQYPVKGQPSPFWHACTAAAHSASKNTMIIQWALSLIFSSVYRSEVER